MTNLESLNTNAERSRIHAPWDEQTLWILTKYQEVNRRLPSHNPICASEDWEFWKPTKDGWVLPSTGKIVQTWADPIEHYLSQIRLIEPTFQIREPLNFLFAAERSSGIAIREAEVSLGTKSSAFEANSEKPSAICSTGQPQTAEPTNQMSQLPDSTSIPVLDKNERTRYRPKFDGTFSESEYILRDNEDVRYVHVIQEQHGQISFVSSKTEGLPFVPQDVDRLDITIDYNPKYDPTFGNARGSGSFSLPIDNLQDAKDLLVIFSTTRGADSLASFDTRISTVLEEIKKRGLVISNFRRTSNIGCPAPE